VITSTLALPLLRWFAVAGATVLAGCAAVGPDYSPPEVAAPSAWTRAEDPRFDQLHREDLARWWEKLNDPLLSQLVHESLVANRSLRLAQARLREARARRLLAGAELFPTVSGSAAVSRAKTSAQVASGRTTELYSAGFDASWEPDIFGGVRRGIEAAQWDLEASEMRLYDTQVSLVAEVALNYVQVRSFQSLLGIARANLDSQAETFQITDWRAQAGLVGALDVEQARANLERTRSQIPALEASLAQAEHRLAVLLACEPRAVRARLASGGPVPAADVHIAVGIPAETLRQRPDVRAAERSLAAQTARIGAAEAARYPGLRLAGSIGLEAFSLGALGASGAAAHSLAATIAMTIFDADRLRQQVEIQSAIAEEALANYQATVLTALEDVENALVSLANNVQRATILARAAEAARNAELLARQRYESGLIDFLTVLDTQRTLLALEDALAVTRAEGTSALVQLYKALGGGWSPS
jgi:NodT family efflux transporter outer membrane factor (OMF) lipoprotein